MENKKEIILPVAVALIGALVFFFAFPERSISTLVHGGLHLPGPGTGLGLITGPFIIMCSLIAYGLTKKKGTAVITSIMFAVFVFLISIIFYVQAGGHAKGVEFIVGAIILGAVLELMIYLLSKKSEIIKYIISAVVADIIFLAYYMCLIFPHTKPESIAQLTINKILIISGVSVIGAIIIGGLLSLLIIRIIKLK